MIVVGIDFADELPELDEQHLNDHDLYREQTCGTPCPGDCVVSNSCDRLPCDSVIFYTKFLYIL